MARSLLENIPDGGDIFLIQGPLTDHNVTLVREGIDETLAGSSLSVVYEPTVRAGLQRTPIPTPRKD